MAFAHGKNTQVLLGGVNLSPYLSQVELGAEADWAETTTFGTTWKTGLTGVLASTLDYEGLYDPAELQLNTFLTTGVPGVLTYAPAGGSAIGDRARMLYAYENAFGQSSPVGGIVAISGTFTGNAVVGYGDILHPLGEDTNTTTGATKTDAAETTTGWTAHLHVMLVDAGSWVVKLQDASASNFSDGADLSGGAFTAATDVTSQRLVGASGATLRKYVRYVATRTGGAGGDGITFALAYSRN